MIRNSKDTIVGIVDESCLIYDPEGLDKAHLISLCDKKSLLNAYDSALSSRGYKVVLNDHDVELPTGDKVNGSQAIFEYFKLDIKAEFLIVCGGPK